eukprot:CAMPEP_0198562198 /NCGR_PEP_ID=MMETSP1462-20131121/96760_1 /TAXON_ID=1333877 /ORGANISM="Brandtodinium nutriculum, Strain RCC3387" /LENGTH=111 /DNA_ID=CAMNT_0044293123 /DNA_START=101 /DNA_END=432 /DNA_ORIENTATION=-
MCSSSPCHALAFDDWPALAPDVCSRQHGRKDRGLRAFALGARASTADVGVRSSAHQGCIGCDAIFWPLAPQFPRRAGRGFKPHVRWRRRAQASAVARARSARPGLLEAMQR